jgi:hypothetical protein
VPEHQRLPADAASVADPLSDADWRRLAIQLGRYALQKSRRFYWRTGTSGELPSGEVPESLVSKALVLWLTGRRRWNRAEYADLQSFLMGVIDSLLSHAANGYDNRGLEANVGHDAVWRTTPETELLDRERAERADRLVAGIIDHARDDRIALEIIEAMRNGATTRRHIVKVTGRSAEDIDNGLKRLRRAGARVAQDGRNGGL